MNNQSRVKNVIQELLKWDCLQVVVCPGGRNAPLTEAFFANSKFKVHSHFDERSASFYALGLSQAQNAPVAVVTTSGTAVSETLSACIEAFYSHTPLIILSADRPKHFRGSGAPQTIEQAGIFSSYCRMIYDIEDENLEINDWDQRSPLHINIGFSEPLFHSAPLTVPEKPNVLNPEQFLSSVKRPLIIVSGSFQFPMEKIKNLLSEVKLPCFFEATSGLKGHADFSNVEIEFPEKLVSKNGVDGVIRIGHVPTHRVWRDLETLSLPVLNFSHNDFSGLSWIRDVWPLEDLNALQFPQLEDEELSRIIERELSFRNQRENALKQFPLSEPALIRSLQQMWSSERMVYLGNSLPIREWDFVSSGKNFPDVRASRGANGIDGQISTFLGLATAKDHPALGVFGDLTCLYDLNAPWVMQNLKSKTFIAVINNGGGMIFDRMFGGKEIHLNRHKIKFENFAQMWGLHYELFDTKRTPFGDHSTLIEIQPDASQTKAFWESLK